MNKLTKLAVCMALPLSGAIFVSAAVAATDTTTFPVTANVVDSCTVAATPLAFGNYNGITALVLDATATITPTCTLGTAYTITLDAGLGTGATLTTRKLSGPAGATLDYAIYTDPTRTTFWGNGGGGTGTRTGVGLGVAQSGLMYARIPASQATSVGSYLDTITVTLSY